MPELLNSQAPDQKSNPQAPDRTYTSISVKKLSQTFEIFADFRRCWKP